MNKMVVLAFGLDLQPIFYLYSRYFGRCEDKHFWRNVMKAFWCWKFRGSGFTFSAQEHCSLITSFSAWQHYKCHWSWENTDYKNCTELAWKSHTNQSSKAVSFMVYTGKYVLQLYPRLKYINKPKPFLSPSFWQTTRWWDDAYVQSLSMNTWQGNYIGQP